jgi:hypothetical protein
MTSQTEDVVWKDETKNKIFIVEVWLHIHYRNMTV